MVLIEGFPDEGRFKSALRDGRWPDWKQMLSEVINESYRLRAAFQAANSEEGKAWFDTTDLEFIDPVVWRARKRAEEADAEAAKTSQERFEAEVGFSI